MPLLRKHLFERQKPPHDLQPDEEVFFCKLTREVFRDYDAFFERIILCNSLVWSCALTGHTNLTYQEALESEAKAREALENFPSKLVGPILYLANLTRRGRHADMMDDVFVYARDRFFIGEIVETVIGNTWCDTKVMKVIPPTEREIAAYKSTSQSPSPSKSAVMNMGRKKFWPPPQLYKYELEEVEPEDGDMIQVHIIYGGDIRREKGLYTREKSHVLLRQCTEIGSDGFWRLKEKVSRKYRIPEIKFEEFFAGPLPKFEETPASKPPSLKSQKVNQMPMTAKKTLSPHKKQKDDKKNFKAHKDDRPRTLSKEKQKLTMMKDSKDQKEGKKKKDKKEDKKQGTLDQWVKTDGKKVKEKTKDKSQEKEGQKKKDNKEHEEKKKKKATPEEIQMEMKRIQEQRERFKEEMKRRAEELKQKRLEERAKEREKMKEEKRILNEFMQEWSKPRDDLECDDLKELPHPNPVQCRIPNHLFGDFLMLLEFFYCFREVLEVKESFGQRGITFDILEQALVENDMPGTLNDIMQLMLKSIFDLQAEEEEEVNDTQIQAKADLDIDEVGNDVTVAQAIKSATAAASWSQTYQGTPLLKLTMDSMTLTEILRLHLLASGGYCGEKNAKWRHQQRGGYTSRDDPGLHFRIEEPQILRELSVSSVYGLSIGNKLKIMVCLMNQILSHVAVRDVIDDSSENLRLTKYELKLHQAAEQRKEREEAAARFRKKMEEKKKLKEEIQRKKEQQLKADETKDQPPQQQQSEEEEKNEEKDDKGKQKEEKTKEIEECLTQRQRESILAKKEKEEAERKRLYTRKEKDMTENISKYQTTVNVQPLGRDRAFRRFWVFKALPGLFVEHDDEYLGPCLPVPTPAFNPESGPPTTEQGLKYVKQLLKDKKASQSLEEKNSSDKENDSVDGDRKKPEVIRTYSNKKLLGDKNVSVVLSSVVKNTENKAVIAVENKLACNVAGTKVELMDIQEEVAKIQSATVARDTGLKQKEKQQSISDGGEQRETRSVGATKLSVFGVCVADNDNCTVHSVILPRTKWAFYSKREDFEVLVQCLNTRGFRENELRQSLIQEKDHILENMAKCPVHKLDQSQEPVDDIEEHRRMTRLQGPKKEIEAVYQNFPPGTPSNDVMELTLRDMILETEEKINFAGLGALKVLNRAKWRDALVNRKYDMQCDKLVWGGETRAGDGSGLTTPEKEVKKEDTGPTEDSQDTEDLDLAKEVSFSNERIDVAVNTMEEEEGDGNEPLADPFQISSAVKDLASAILQLAQSLETKYLKKPLGEDTKEKKRRKRAEEKMKKEREEEHEDEDDDEGDEDVEEKDRIIRTPLERWEMSLMSCTSFSQLFIHFNTLENSVAWSRSALNASCCFCHKKSDPENMLLCDGCDKGQHIYCLKPKLKCIPEGEWFCNNCRPKEKPRTPRKTRRLFSEESEDEEAEDEEEEESESSSEGEDEEDSDEGSEHHDECDVCNKGGHVICCDTCPLVFHLNCIVPPLNKVPRGKWSCPQCKPPLAAPIKRNKETDKKSKTRHVLDFNETKKDRKCPSKDNVETSRNSRMPSNRHSLETIRVGRSSLETSQSMSTRHSLDSGSGRRRCASEAVEKIFISLKRLRSSESFEDSDESWPSSVRGSKRLSNGRRGLGSEGDFDVAVLEDLLHDLAKHTDGWPFLRPVSKTDAPDYHDIIKRPMDFGTMNRKLNNMKYASNSEFLADVLLVFENCQMYNRTDTDEYRAGQRLSKYFHSKIEDYGLIITPDGSPQRDAKKQRLN